MLRVPYASVVDSLMYVMICARLDISHVNVVSRRISNHGKTHWQSMKWIMRCLRGFMEISLVYHISRLTNCIVGYVDFNYASELGKRRSLMVYTFTLFGCTVSWKAIFQSIVALSTNEAEYMTVTEGVKEAIWLHGLAYSLSLWWQLTIMCCDRLNAVHLGKNPMCHELTKQIDVRYHFIQEIINKTHCAVKHMFVPNQQNTTCQFIVQNLFI